MTFLSPVWLLGLLPWVGVSVYLLWGRRQTRPVPFLELWRVPVEGKRIRRKFAAPPLAVALALAGLFLALVAAAAPVVRWPGTPTGQPVVVIVDRGIEMSARSASSAPGAGQAPRYRVATAAAAKEVAGLLGPAAPVHLYLVPATGSGSERVATDVAELPRLLDAVRPTAVDTTDMLRRQVRQGLAETAASAGPVIVVSDADLGGPDARLVQVAPGSPVRNIGIVRLAARSSPRPQVMVRIRNDSGMTAAVLRVNTAEGTGGVVERTVTLPLAGGEADQFVDVKQLGAVVSAELVADDDLPADNYAFLVREGAWPRIESATAVGDLRRLIDLYGTLRPPVDGSPTVRVVARPADLAAGQPGVVASPNFSPGGGVARPTRVAAHPVTDALGNWADLDLPLGTSQPAPSDWTSILWAGERPLVAVQDSPARRAWVAIDTNRWSNRPEYVVFWTALFDWVGGGGEIFAAHPLGEWDPDWRPAETPPPALAAFDPPPGVYVRADGVRRAFNPKPARTDRTRASEIRGAAGDDWAKRLAGAWLHHPHPPGRRLAAPVLLLAAVGFLTAAVGAWRPTVRPSR